MRRVDIGGVGLVLVGVVLFAYGYSLTCPFNALCASWVLTYSYAFKGFGVVSVLLGVVVIVVSRIHLTRKLIPKG